MYNYRYLTLNCFIPLKLKAYTFLDTGIQKLSFKAAIYYGFLSGQGMFFPQLFGIVGQKLVHTKDRQYDDPEDLYDDRYLLEVRDFTYYYCLLFSILAKL